MRFFCKGIFTRYDYCIRFIFWGMKMNADDLIPVDFIMTTFEMHRFRVCSLDFIHQNTNRVRLRMFSLIKLILLWCMYLEI